MHGTNYTRLQEWVPAVLQSCGWSRPKGMYLGYLAEDPGASSPPAACWSRRGRQAVKPPAGTAEVFFIDISAPSHSRPFVDKCPPHSATLNIKWNRRLGPQVKDGPCCSDYDSSCTTNRMCRLGCNYSWDIIEYTPSSLPGPSSVACLLPWFLLCPRRLPIRVCSIPGTSPPHSPC